MTDYLLRMYDIPTNPQDIEILEGEIQSFIDEGYRLITINNSGIELIYHFIKAQPLPPLELVLEQFDIDDIDEEELEEDYLEDELDEDEEETLARVRRRNKRKYGGPNSDDWGRD